MKKSRIYRMTIARQNTFKEMFYGVFIGFCSYPRLLLEVFIKKGFGPAYLNLGSILTLTAMLYLYPMYFGMSARLMTFTDVIKSNLSWYLFTAAFLFFGIKRWIEMLNNPDVAEFKYFSNCDGFFIYPKAIDWWANFLRRDISNKLWECLLEPLPFYLIGTFVLLFVHEQLGVLIFICAIIYSISHLGQYAQGDAAIRSIMDDDILARQTHRIMVENKPPSEVNGGQIRFTRPRTMQACEDIADASVIDDNTEDAEAVVL